MFLLKILDCEDAYGENLFADQMICSGEEGKDSCQVIFSKVPKRMLNF
jgi:hypothetical protein